MKAFVKTTMFDNMESRLRNLTENGRETNNRNEQHKRNECGSEPSRPRGR